MVATAAAIIGALGTVAGVGTSIAGMGAQSAQQAKQYGIQLQGLEDARQNSEYQRALSAMINQRSVAGTQDSFGSTVQYDPGTNTWVSKLGPLPEATQRAADQASIRRNTTDMQMAELANQEAARRATQAAPAYDTAIRNVQSFKPMGRDELVGLLSQQATRASNATFAPLRQDMIRQYMRSGTAAGPVLAQLGRQQEESLRNDLVDAQIKGMTSVDQLNQGRRQGLEQTAANTATLSQPQFQYPGVNPSNINDTMANLVSARAQRSALDPAYGAGGVNTASAANQTALAALAGKVPGDTHAGADAAKTIADTLRSNDFQKNLTTIGSSLFGPKVYDGSLSGTTYDQPQDYYKLAQGLSLGNDASPTGVYPRTAANEESF